MTFQIARAAALFVTLLILCLARPSSLAAQDTQRAPTELAVAGEESEWAIDFEAHFGRTPASYSQNIKRLRIAGWVLMGASLNSLVIPNSVPAEAGGDHDVTIPAIVGIAAGGTFIISGVLLLIARIRSIRQHRWQNAHGDGELRAELERRWDLHLGATRVGLSLRF